MAKGILIALALICTTCVRSVSAECSGHDSRVEAVQKLYSQEIGVRELTDRNDGERVQLYLKSTGLQGNYAWCGAFVNWVLKSCQVSPRAAYGARAASWFSVSERLLRKKDKTVDWAGVRPTHLFALYYANLGRIGHVGFIDQVNESSVITVEGNTNEAGSREGNGVWRKRRMKRAIYQVANWTYQ